MSCQRTETVDEAAPLERELAGLDLLMLDNDRRIRLLRLRLRQHELLHRQLLEALEALAAHPHPAD